MRASTKQHVCLDESRLLDAAALMGGERNNVHDQYVNVPDKSSADGTTSRAVCRPVTRDCQSIHARSIEPAASPVVDCSTMKLIPLMLVVLAGAPQAGTPAVEPG